MKAINIYITPEQKIELDRICYKYKVSKSTIAEKVLFILTKHINWSAGEKRKEIQTKLGTTYIYENSGTKTSIKPKPSTTHVLNAFYTNISKAYTNAVQIYLRKDIDKWIGKELTQKFYNDLNTELQKTNEPNWDFNRFRRQMAKYEKGKQ